MRLECPACAAAYDVPDTLLKPGRPVRCVRCNALWQPEPPMEVVAVPPPRPAPAPTPTPTPPPLQPGRPPAISSPHGGKPAAPWLAPALAWAASLAVLAGVVGALVYYRADVIAAWPPAARLFSAFGLG